MEPEWLNYQEVGDRLGITPEAARSRAKRLGWRRQLNNHGRAVVLVALEPRPPDDRPVTPGRKAADPQVISALEAQTKALQAHIELLTQQLAASELREGQGRADLEAERAQTAKAIGALAALADRLDALAAANPQRRPWWRRLVG